MAGAIAGRIATGRAAVAIAGAAALVLVALAGGELGRTALRAAGVLGGLAVAAAWLRRPQGPSSHPAVSVESRQPLSREAGVALVRVEARRLLLGYGPRGVTLVTELARPEGLDARNGATSSLDRAPQP